LQGFRRSESSTILKRSHLDRKGGHHVILP
jgi:hypothetical protein